MRDLPHLSYLQAFEAAARHLSFTRAAKELNCTQAAISQRVRGIEKYFGRPLFLRKPNGLELSQAGKAYLPGVSRALDLMEASTRGLTGHGGHQSVTISAPISFINLWLAPRIDGFLSHHPAVELRMNGAIWTDPNLDLADFSIAIVERASISTGSRVLARVPLLLVRPAAPGAVARRIEVQGKYPFWDLWACGQHTDIGATPIRVETAVTALDLVAAGVGQTVVYAPYAKVAGATGKVALGVQTEIDHVLVLRVNPDRHLTFGARAFLEWLLSHFPAVEG